MQPCSQPRYGLMDCENGTSGEALRAMIVRVGSIRISVSGRRSGGASSPAASGSGASATVTTAWYRDGRFESAPRPVIRRFILYEYTAIGGLSTDGYGAPNRSSRRNPGNSRAHSAATASVAIPPTMTAGFSPHHDAVSPDSNSPSSLDAPMNIELTALTRPRIASGVSSCTSTWRTNTLTMSAA